MQDGLIPAKTVAFLLGVRVSTVYSLCKRRSIPHVRIAEGARRPLIRFRADDIERFIKERTSVEDRREAAR